MSADGSVAAIMVEQVAKSKTLAVIQVFMIIFFFSFKYVSPLIDGYIILHLVLKSIVYSLSSFHYIFGMINGEKKVRAGLEDLLSFFKANISQGS